MTGEEREGDGAEDGGDFPTLAAGAIVGRYRIIQLIGRGGMGVVYRAQHIDLGTLRALKTLAPELVHDPRARSRFLKEARQQRGLNIRTSSRSSTAVSTKASHSS
jgi:serine/threonine protein kinase